MTSTNPWLTRQRKSDLVELADGVGLKNYDGFNKSELQTALDEYLSENSAQYSSDPKFASYFASRQRATGSPIKKETAKDDLKVAKRRATKVAEETPAEEDASTSTALTRTPGRALSLASRIPLPASPADVAHAVERRTTAVKARVASLYQESGITEATESTRAALSTVTSIIFAVAAFELYYIRPEVLANRYAFTIPAVAVLGTSDYPVYIPDMFLLLTASFWSPATTWALTSFIVPSLFGYFFNLTVGAKHGRGRKASEPDYAVDPLTFSIVKAVITYIVYAQKVTFAGWLDTTSIERLDSAVYGGWQGVLVGTAVTALASVYDAVLKK